MTEQGSPQWAAPGGQPAPPVPQYAGAPANYYTGGQPPVPGPAGPGGPAGPVGPVPGAPPRPDTRGGPVRVEPVPGTEFGIAIASVPPTFSGQATGSLVAGIGSIGVSLAVGCFGVIGGPEGWGVLVSGAFAILAGLLGLASIGLGLVAVRLIKASRGRFAGRGVAISGIVCGATGVVLTAGGMLLAAATLVAA